MHDRRAVTIEDLLTRARVDQGPVSIVRVACHRAAVLVDDRMTGSVEDPTQVIALVLRGQRDVSGRKVNRTSLRIVHALVTCVDHEALSVDRMAWQRSAVRIDDWSPVRIDDIPVRIDGMRGPRRSRMRRR